MSKYYDEKFSVALRNLSSALYTVAALTEDEEDGFSFNNEILGGQLGKCWNMSIDEMASLILEVADNIEKPTPKEEGEGVLAFLTEKVKVLKSHKEYCENYIAKHGDKDGAQAMVDDLAITKKELAIAEKALAAAKSA